MAAGLPGYVEMSDGLSRFMRAVAAEWLPVAVRWPVHALTEG